MNQVARLHTVALAAIIAAAPIAHAAPAHNVCVPRAVGVPTRPGPPKWLDWSSSGTTAADPALDDPRWLGATGHSFELGGARAPLLSRALWATATDGKAYLYLSFIVDLEGLTGAGAATPRDLFLGFRRPTPFAGSGGNEVAYIFQFHLTTGAVASLVRPQHCSRFSTCDENSGTALEFWRVFVDRGAAPEACPSSPSVMGQRFDRFVDTADASKPPIPWMTKTGPPDQPNEDAVRFWKLDASQPPVLQNRWAIQLRLPIAPDDTRSLEEGIPPGATFWYQGSAALTGSGGLYANIGWWPRAEITQPVCPATALQDYLIHPDLNRADNWSRISRFAGAPPADCDKGLTIRTPNIGAVFDAAPGADFAAVPLTTQFKATRPDGSVAANTVVAQVVNTSPTDITAPIMARFRLASWGSAPWTPGDTGKWKDMRGAENGVCGAGSPPSCGPAPPFRIPALIDANNDGLPDAGTNNRAAIKFQWTIGIGTPLGASEYCKFGLTPPGGGCGACLCTDSGALCDATTDTGTRATVGPTVSPCASKNYEHQCLFVELSAPTGGVDFAQQSSWNNMNFAQMSETRSEALIDARQLPRAKDQKEQDIYLIAMPRNMPRTIPGGAKDGALFIRERALAVAERRAEPFLKDLGKLTPGQLDEIKQKLNRQAGGIDPIPLTHDTQTHLRLNLGDMGERFKRVSLALQIMPDPDYKVVTGLLRVVASEAKPAALTEGVVRVLGPAEAAEVVPTLEIYPFYRHLGAGTVYMPMSAFTVFLSHEGPMTGMTWAIDGAEQVGQNVYHLKIPVGFAKRIQVRAQAIEPNGALLAPPNAKWPCSGCCQKNCGLVGQVGNAWPGLLAGLYVALRGRRRRRPSLSLPPETVL
jgi:hypothetical protein